MQKIIAVALLLLGVLTFPAWADMFQDASNAQLPQALDNFHGNKRSHTYYVQAYGACTWDDTHDVGPCINAAITAAAANNGGTVILPAGTYGLSTQVNVLSNVRLEGAGAGNFQFCGTRIESIGGFVGRMFSWDTGTGAVVSNSGMKGVCVDANTTAATIFYMRGVQRSTFENLVLVDSTTKVVDQDVPALALDPGGGAPSTENQFRDMMVRAKGTGTGWWIGPGTAQADTNSNTFDNVRAIAENAPGVAFDCGGADSNRIFNFRADATGTADGLVLRAGFDADKNNWCRYNEFYGVAIGQQGANGLVVETGMWPSVGNMIHGYKKGGNEPNPTLQAGTTLQCFDTFGQMCPGTTPLKLFKHTTYAINKTANYTIGENDCGASFSNRLAAAGSTIVFTLPAATGSGCVVDITKWSQGDQVTITPQGVDFIRGAAGSTAAGESIYARTTYATVRLEDVASTNWQVKQSSGPWFNLAGGPSPVGGWVGLGSLAATAPVSQFSFSAIPPGLAAVRLTCGSLVPTTDAVNARVIVGTGVTPTWVAADYAYAVVGEDTTGPDPAGRSTTATQGLLVNAATVINANAAAPLAFDLVLHDPGSTTAHKHATWAATYEDDVPRLTTSRGGGAWVGATTPITGLRFAFQAGTIAAGGRCALAGLVP